MMATGRRGHNPVVFLGLPLTSHLSQLVPRPHHRRRIAANIGAPSGAGERDGEGKVSVDASSLDQNP